MKSIETITLSVARTQELGRLVGECCCGGECFLLHGPLGAGKTCWVKGLAVGLGVGDVDDVVSPTFVIHQQYFGRLELNHLDAYRLGEDADVSELGFEELIDCGGVTAVEWAEYIEAQLPESCLDVTISLEGPEERRFCIAPRNQEDRSYDAFLARLQERLSEAG